MDSSCGKGRGNNRITSTGYSKPWVGQTQPEGAAAAYQQPIGIPYPAGPALGNQRASSETLSVSQSMALQPALPDPFYGSGFVGRPSQAPRAGTSYSSVTCDPSSQLSGMASPLTSDASNALMRSPLTGDTPSHLKVPMRVPEVTRSFEQVALPSEMPIGSLVHQQTPPTFGVAKISNIPYAITKQEIVQFFGRQARLIAPQKGCPVHIIMERSTAKTMDCYVEFDTPNDAKAAVDRVNRIQETGRPPRLGNRHVDVEVSSQDALLKDLFPRAKCIKWQDGFPVLLPNTDPYSSGFTGFLTSEEIVGCLRHAEIPHRSPFSQKCPQRTYESTISTIGKFPWYAKRLYTVGDRNMLFDLVSRHLKALSARIKKSNTVGLDQRLLRDLLYCGLKCPAFNERMKYTLCCNSEDHTEILRFPDMGKWFPFDTLVKMPDFDEPTLLYYVNLIAKGAMNYNEVAGLRNSFPKYNHNLVSIAPYGPVWFEWSFDEARDKVWEEAVQLEMVILCGLIMNGWVELDQQPKPIPIDALRDRLSSTSMSIEPGSSQSVSPQVSHQVSPEDKGKKPAAEDSRSLVPEAKRTLNEIYVTPARRAANKSVRHVSFSDSKASAIPNLDTPTRPFRRGGLHGGFGHRNTLSLSLPSSQPLEE